MYKMCIQLKSNQILNHPYITLAIIQERGEVQLTAVCKTIFLISLALIEIEEVSLCHSISLPKWNLKTTKVLGSFALSHQDCSFLFTDSVAPGHENGNFLFTSGRKGWGGWSLHPCISSLLKNMPRVFPDMEILLLLLCYYYLVVVLLHLYTKPQEELGILCAVMWSVKPAASSLPQEAAARKLFKWSIKWCCCQTGWLLGDIE